MTEEGPERVINVGDNENYNKNNILTEKNSEINSKKESNDNELLECAQFPFITQKSGRHQLHPFSTATSMVTVNPNETEEILLRVQQLDESFKRTKGNDLSNIMLLEDGARSDTVLPNFPEVSQKSGQYQIHPCSTTAIPSTSSNAQKTEEPSNIQNKRGTLTRMFRNLKSSNKLSHDEISADYEYKEKGLKQVQQIEGTTQKSSGTFGKMLNKMNNVSKESKTSISKAIHRVSDALTSASKHKKEESTNEKKPNVILSINAKEKCASIGRKVSSIGSHFSKQNVIEGEKPRGPKVDDNPSEGNIDPKLNAKQSINEKASTLTRKISSIGSHFHTKTMQNSGSGEVAPTD